MPIARPLAVGLLLTFVALLARAADQTLLGNQLAVKNPSTAVRRQIVVKAKEERSTNTIVGNPVAAGATLTITANGGSSSEQTYLLPVGTSGFTGKPFWSADADGFEYRDARGENGAVKLVRIRKAGNGRFTLKAVLSGRLGAIGVLPPAPGTSGCALLSLTGGNDDLIRSGRATMPQPPLPDASHPKTHVAVLASAFCVPATGQSGIDQIAGLPGPGTMLLHGTAEWTKY